MNAATRMTASSENASLFGPVNVLQADPERELVDGEPRSDPEREGGDLAPRCRQLGREADEPRDQHQRDADHEVV
jgi:hypothetical protein